MARRTLSRTAIDLDRCAPALTRRLELRLLSIPLHRVRLVGWLILVGALVALTGCPRQQFALGGDWRDAGSSSQQDAGMAPPDAGPDVGACGNLGLMECPDGEYCNYPPDAMCGEGDQRGQCTSKPSVCPEVYQPVCGCDWVDYDNACAAAAAGVAVAYAKKCDLSPTIAVVCGGTIGSGCPDGLYCLYAPEAACGQKQSGSCKPIGDSACTREYTPVCGCDDQSYDSACRAAAAGVSVAHEGPCSVADGGTAAQSCGSRGLPECPSNQYCAYPTAADCGRADAAGQCSAKPNVCDDDYTPVCGCDDKTYSNACAAAAAGISVGALGACASPRSCGGLTGQPCPSGQYCSFPSDAFCGAADAPGQCAAIPSACTLELNPVCGCDDQSYDNPCRAAMAGISVRAQGACSSQALPGKACGGLVGAQCPTRQYCDFPASALCGAADQTGTCAEMPQICTQQYSPVCGCDDKTYANPCEAASAGVSVRASGSC